MEITKKYFIPMFDSRHSVVFTCVPPSKSSDYEKFFASQGYDVVIEEIAADLDYESGSEGSESESESELE